MPPSLSGGSAALLVMATTLAALSPAARAATSPPTPASSPAPTVGATAALDSAETELLRPGTASVVTGDYRGADLPIEGLAVPAEFLAHVVAPVADGGRHPLVVFLHGRHVTCAASAADEGRLVWPCPGGSKAIPSYRGFDETQRLLASRGYVTVSISTNAVNAHDADLDDRGEQARARLVEAHLARWVAWTTGSARTAPAIVRAGARADLDRVLLVGHSRGGEGLNRVALDAMTPGTSWTVGGVVHLASTAFGQHPAPGVAVVALLPECDGDEYAHAAQGYVDDGRRAGRDPALRTSVLVRGANHAFFNAVWTPGSGVGGAVDDAQNLDDACRSDSPKSTRLTPAAQRRVGSAAVSAAADSMLRGDARATRLLDGTQVRPSAGAPVVTTHALGGRRVAVLLPTRGTRVDAVGPAEARVCVARQVLNVPFDRWCGQLTGRIYSPHTLAPPPPFEGLASRAGVEAAWTGRRARIHLPAGASSTRPADLSSSERLELRAAVVGGEGATEMHLAARLTDAAGASVVLATATVPVPPSTQMYSGAVASAVSFALPRTGIDLRRIVAVDLLPRDDVGGLVLYDAWGWSPGASTAPPASIPRVDLPTVAVPEGDGATPIAIPLTITRPSTKPSTIRVAIADQNGAARFVDVAVPARATRVLVPSPYRGDTVPGPDRTVRITLQSTDTAVAGSWTGRVVITDDDGAPAQAR